MKTTGRPVKATPLLSILLILGLILSACTSALDKAEEIASDAIDSASDIISDFQDSGDREDGDKPQGETSDSGEADSGSDEKDPGPETDEQIPEDSGDGQQSDELDYSQVPNFGEVDLQAGFTPDPYTLNMVSGGSVDASYLSDPDCYGYATSAPDFRVFWSGSSSQLRFFFEGEGDTTLIINTPSGDWSCNDDSFGTVNPTVTFNNPSTGQYDIWVGSFSSGDFISGNLYITELDITPGGQTNGTDNGNGLGLDFTQDPNFGEVDLQAGFTPDPYTVNMTSGGSVDASYLSDPDCYGYATSAPDFRVFWSGSSSQLRFFFEGEGDTTLIINTPSGDWSCDDDSYGTTDPTVTFNNPSTGQYDIWVGSFSSGDFVSGTLNITELDITPGGQSNGSGNGNGLGLDFTQSPNFGEVDLQAGFTPDPYTVNMTSGGSVDASYLSDPDCYGYATSAPDFRVFWSGSSSRLRFFFEGDGDTTLIINTPSGDWSCDDDSYGTTDPTVTFSNPSTGQYDIWVGSFSSGDFVSGTLNITELDLTP